MRGTEGALTTPIVRYRERDLANMSEEKEVDIYRDTPVRLLGYANEVGEAFRALVHVR